MKARPTIFLSGVSHELGSFRDAVETEIQKKGCFPENQPSFPPDYRTVEEMLRRKLHEADAVVHIVGFRFGAEPNQRPGGASRRSYTQMEFDIARATETPVYVFLSMGASVRDDAKQDENLEDAAAVALQLAHRDAVQKSNHLYYFFKDKAELCNLVAQIPPVQAAGFQADISRIIKFAPAELIGRDDELKVLNEAWLKVRRAESSRPRILTFVALGGEGKTSLVAKWAAELAHQDWLGCDAAFAWSFYSQGTREQMAASSDLFLKEALMFFGDASMAESAQGAFDKGRRLAQLVGERRALLILDGLEPLQYAPTSPTAGELKDQGLAALLKALAASSHGLCVLTTRYSISDLRAYWQATAPQEKLTRLSKEAGVSLLRSLGTKGTQKEFETLVEDVKGHALTLTLLGSFLCDAHAGDIRKRDLVKIEEADAEEQGGHAFRVMDEYVRCFDSEGENGQRAVAVLRLMGLFDRPATADCLNALLQTPAISGLTELLVGLTETQLNLTLTRLEGAKLLNKTPDDTTLRHSKIVNRHSLDAHPLLREYFARRVSEQQPEAWRAAHRRLYEHLCASTLEGDQPTLEALQPLYQAVAHGCQAGLQQEAHDTVWFERIRKRNDYYSTNKLGAFGSDLGAVACFFETPWRRVSPLLKETDQAVLLNNAAMRLRALGRLTEALEPMRAGLEMGIKQEVWKSAAITASNLSELKLTLGEVAAAVGDAGQSVTYADRSGDVFQRLSKRTTHADALHQAGHRAEAETRFREAEQMKVERQPEHPLFYSVQGFKYCDLLLAASERAAWHTILQIETRNTERETALTSCHAVCQRAVQTLKWMDNDPGVPILTIAVEHLTLGRAKFYRAILENSAIENPKFENENALSGLRRAGRTDYLPRALLTRAWQRSLTGSTHSTSSSQASPESAQSDLDEAWEIAERGPMRLHMADIHLHRARLFFREANYPWESPHKDLAEARRLIEKCGYWRRKEELEDAELAILGKPAK